MRVSNFAKANRVLSRDVIDLANMTGQNLKSASSNISINEDNRIYWECVKETASKRRLGLI